MYKVETSLQCGTRSILILGGANIWVSWNTFPARVSRRFGSIRLEEEPRLIFLIHQVMDKRQGL
jgi:hypothetical protein